MKKVRPKVSLDNEKIRYADIEVRYNEEREEFLFLEKVQDGKYLVDAINKGKIEIYDTIAFKQFDKALILEEGKDYTPNELLEIYNFMSKSKVNFTFGKNKQTPKRRKESKEFIEIKDDTEFAYEELEILFNKDTQEFYFLKSELDEMLNLSLFDAISGVKITSHEVAGYKRYDKFLILERRVYTSGELSKIYRMMNENKVNFTFPESEVNNQATDSLETIPDEIIVTDDTKYKYEELEAKINYSTGSIYFLVAKTFQNAQGFDQIVRYDAINGQKLSNSLLSEYEELEKEILFTEKRDYTAQEISKKYRFLHEFGIINLDENNSDYGNKGSKK